MEASMVWGGEEDALPGLGPSWGRPGDARLPPLRLEDYGCLGPSEESLQGLRCLQASQGQMQRPGTLPAPRSQGRRGRVITEYKNKTANGIAASPPILPASPSNPVFQPPLEMKLADCTVASPYPESPSPYGQSFFLDLIPDYMDGVYPVQPVIPEHELRSYIQQMDSDQDVRSFIFAFGAATLNLTRIGDKRTEEVVQTIQALMNYSVESMRPALASFHSTVIRAMQSMFIHNCLMSLSASDAAFYYMRDSISCIQLLRIDDPDSMATLAPPERSRRQRLYWQAYIHERFLAVLDYRLAILPPLDSLPEDDPTIPLQVHEGFIQIIKLFRLLDPDFLKNWSQGSNVTSAWVEEKSRELEGDAESNARELANLTMMQRADLAITREWLRTLVWRLAMGQALLSSRSSKECLSLLFPIRLSQNLRVQVTSMSREDIEVHGSSITQKLFEITDTIADVLIHVPAATLEETSYRIDDYLFILDFVLLFPTLDRTRRSILLEKLERLQNMFPEVCSNANSPNLPTDMQSPTNDPWYQVTQSKFGPEVSSEATGLGGVLPPQNVGPPQPVTKVAQQAAWNHISRRLSMATFTNPQAAGT
ncbi:hypothetical protein BS50DRAFT_601912 [Corynespora cassiicola Philippines]|uniref:Transcription factor domain-containing protein n=1 Tax=Corynespora cassiicola Philippines TaxID=1448308 RepID=A0A2T2NJI3_CORCC|nr:hypothetical protein BS50DRAFT_601912 [Corynespora cassiicola Philippines]